MPESGTILPLLTRRDFCAHTCRAAAALTLGGAAACGGKSPTSPSGAPPLGSVSATVAGRVVTVAVDAASAIGTVGGAAVVQTGLGTFLVSRTSTAGFTVLTATCTHEACTVTGFEGGRYVCPCHGSQYSTSGDVLQGPAPRALQAFPAQFANGVLTFTA